MSVSPRRPHVPLVAVSALVLALDACAGGPSMGSSASEGTSEGTSTGTSEGTSGSGSTGTGTGTAASTSTSASGGESGTTGDPLACWTDLEVGEAVTFYQGFKDGSEGIAFGVDGLLYATTDGIVWRLSPAGVAEKFAEVPDALGLAPWANGDLVVASFGVYNQPDGAIYTVNGAGEATFLVDGIDSPNFVVIAGDGSALVSDDFDTRVFRVTTAGALSVVIEDVPSPNGMAYSADGTSFYVASTFTAEGQLTRYDVDADGLPIAASGREILQLGLGSTPDGIAVDEENRVYVAANLKNQIWRVDGDAEALTEGELVTEAVKNPASLAFGQGPDYDPCSIYVTELDGDRIVRVAIGSRGAPLYR
ncbi:MAG TPA: SMP-30/gluconolactonase/LRE family protein [Nannocystaceae bacterium]|nr:SMP-30/gluconolactonase/LRE family protein [Nannocystaceae bacterium]